MPNEPVASDQSTDVDLAAVSAGLRLDDREIVQLIHSTYGLEVTVSALDGDRDANYRVTTSSGAVGMFKIIHPEEHPAITAGQDSLLSQLAAVAPDLPVPRVILALDGSTSCLARTETGRDFAIRLVTFLGGVPVGSLSADRWNPYEFGASIGELMNAMAEITPQPGAVPLIWDLMQPQRVLDLAPLEAPQPGDELAVGVLQQFAPPTYADLPWQVLHNDLNPGNVLVDALTGRTSAFIDFGDSVHGPRIAEVAVALSYLIDADQAPEQWDAVATLRGIHAICPLLAQEIEVLFDLIAVRLALTILVAHWRATRFPANAEYITRNTDDAVRRLDAMTVAGPAAMTEIFRAVTSSVARS